MKKKKNRKYGKEIDTSIYVVETINFGKKIIIIINF